MSYARNFTMINELPELSDLDGVGDYEQTENAPDDPRFQKHIRMNRPILREAGMESYNPRPTKTEHYERTDPGPPPPSPPVLNCLDVANHVQSCPICSRFYHNDKTPYIIAIVILAIICILLLKKVLDV